MKKILTLVALSSMIALVGCQKIDDAQKAPEPQASNPKSTVSNPQPATPSTAGVTTSGSLAISKATSEKAQQLGIFGQSFEQLISAIKIDTKNGVIPPTHDDAVISRQLSTLSDEERLNLFKVIYIRAAANEAKSSTALNPDSLNAKPSTIFVPETPGDKVLGGLSGQ